MATVLITGANRGLSLEFVKQYLHLKLQALFKFKSIPLVFVPTFPSFLFT